MAANKTKENMEKIGKGTQFSSETAKAAQAASVVSRNLHTLMVESYNRELMKKAKGSTLTKQEKITKQVIDKAAEGDVQMIKIYTSVALSTQIKETRVEETDKGILITSVGAITADEATQL